MFPVQKDVILAGADQTAIDAVAASMMGDIMWCGPLKPVQNIFMRTPLVNIFIAGSEIYHDYYRWPLKDRRTFEIWLERSPWGHLFQQYMRATPKQAAAVSKVS